MVLLPSAPNQVVSGGGGWNAITDAVFHFYIPGREMVDEMSLS